MSTYLRRSLGAAFLALTAFGLGSCGADSTAEVATLRYGIDDERNFNRLPQVIAEREGFFAREGLNVEIVNFASSFREPAEGQTAAAADATTVREAMDSGSIHMSRQQLPLLINDVMTGRVSGTYVGVSTPITNSVYFLAVRPEITSFADLRGKVVTITGLHDGITVWTRELLALHGLGKDDVELKVIAGSQARFTCLESGECAAASLAQPAVFQALDAGYQVLGITNAVGPLFYQLDIVNPAWAAANRDAVIKYIRAITAAVAFIQDPANRGEVVRVTMDFMQESEDRTRQMLSYVWDPANRVLPQQPAFNLDDTRDAIALLGKYDVLAPPLPAPERFVDPSYAAAAGQ